MPESSKVSAEDQPALADMRRGGQKGFRILYDKYENPLKACLQKHYHISEQEVETFCQEIFLQFYLKLARFEEKCSIYTWLCYHLATDVLATYFRSPDYQRQQEALFIKKLYQQHQSQERKQQLSVSQEPDEEESIEKSDGLFEETENAEKMGASSDSEKTNVKDEQEQKKQEKLARAIPELISQQEIKEPSVLLQEIEKEECFWECTRRMRELLKAQLSPACYHAVDSYIMATLNEMGFQTDEDTLNVKEALDTLYEKCQKTLLGKKSPVKCYLYRLLQKFGGVKLQEIAKKIGGSHDQIKQFITRDCRKLIETDDDPIKSCFENCNKFHTPELPPKQ